MRSVHNAKVWCAKDHKKSGLVVYQPACIAQPCLSSHLRNFNSNVHSNILLFLSIPMYCSEQKDYVDILTCNGDLKICF